MATITHACGHTIETMNDTPARRAKIEAAVCASCVTAQAERDAAATITSYAALPALTGSEKQVAWASSLRDEAVTLLRAGLVDAYRRCNSLANPVEARAEIDAEIERVFADTSAARWIDTRLQRRFSWS